MNPETYHLLEAAFERRYLLFAPALPFDSKASTNFYLAHGELEMAVEGFCLDLMEKNIALPQQIRLSLVELCQSPRLDQESVFAFDFWERFQQYIFSWVRINFMATGYVLVPGRKTNVLRTYRWEVCASQLGSVVRRTPIAPHPPPPLLRKERGVNPNAEAITF